MILLSCGTVSLEFLGGAWGVGGQGGGSTAGGPLEHSSYWVCEEPHLYSLFSLHSRSTSVRKHTRTHKQARADILLNGRALLLPQSMEYHICLFTPRFLSLNSINIYIAAEGVGSPSCSGGKLSLDENELQSSLPRHRLVCLYLHYPAIPQLPLSRLGSFFFFLFFSSYHHLLQLASYVTL